MRPSLEVGAVAVRLDAVGDEAEPHFKSLSHKTAPQAAVSLCPVFFDRLTS